MRPSSASIPASFFVPVTLLLASLAEPLGAAPAPAAASRVEAPAARPAVAVLASAKGKVSVDRPGTTAPLEGSLGMRLQPGDTVRVGSGGAATVYLAGGGLVRVPAGSRIEIPKESAQVPDPSLRAAMSSRSVEVLEAGLWILNDPDGSVLLSAMRGDADDWSDGRDSGPQPLSPRYETLLDERPRFVWSGGEARVVVAHGREILWRFPASSGSIVWPSSAPELQPGEMYRWWLESAEGGAPGDAVPFRIAETRTLADSERFEKEVARLAAGDDPALAGLLRCGFYVEAGAWTKALAAAARLRRQDPASEAAARAFDGSRRKMRLGEDAAAKLASLVAPLGAPESSPAAAEKRP
jgi:hypothetical protein